MDLSGTLTEIPDLWEGPGFRQRALAFVGFGLIASASGLALIALDSNSDPGKTFEVALLQTPGAASAEAPLVHETLAREMRDFDGVTREIAKGENPKSCPHTASAENRCGSGAASNPEMAAPVSSLSNPDMAAPVSRPPPLAVVPPADVENAPTAEFKATALSDAGPAGVETPALKMPATTERKTVRQQPRRAHYAQQRHFWPFW